MSDDPELLRLRAFARIAEERYLRLKLLLTDPATVKAAHEIWAAAVVALRDYEEAHKL